MPSPHAVLFAGSLVAGFGWIQAHQPAVVAGAFMRENLWRGKKRLGVHMAQTLKAALEPLMRELANEFAAPSADHGEIFDRATATGSAVAQMIFAPAVLH